MSLPGPTLAHFCGQGSGSSAAHRPARSLRDRPFRECPFLQAKKMRKTRNRRPLLRLNSERLRNLEGTESPYDFRGLHRFRMASWTSTLIRGSLITAATFDVKLAPHNAMALPGAILCSFPCTNIPRRARCDCTPRRQRIRQEVNPGFSISLGEVWVA